MKKMEQKILAEGKILPGGVLKVGSFLNQQIDTVFMEEIGKEIAELFKDDEVTKILTIEASGIPIAVSAGFAMHLPVVYAKKNKSSNISGDVYCAMVHSFTHGNNNNVIVSKEFISPDDKILIVDDVISTGESIAALEQLVETVGGETAGKFAVLAEGEAADRKDITYLEYLPLFNADGTPQ